MTDTATYDVVIIGAGMGGLMSALLLAKEGMKVCVLEKNKQIGGCLQLFGLKKKKFDACVHYLGGLGEGHSLNQMLRYAGVLNDLKLIPLDPNGFDRIVLGDDPTGYPQAMGSQNFVEQLLPFFPNERVALQGYVDVLENVIQQIPLYNLRLGNSSEKAAVADLELCATIEKLTQNPKLRDVILGNNILYAGIPGHTPFATHAVVLHAYMHSAHKISTEGPSLVSLMRQVIRAQGGDILRNTDITRLHTGLNGVEYAEASDGRRFYGKQFIAAVPPDVVFRLSDGQSHRPITRQRVLSHAQTPSGLMLNIVLKPGAIPYRPYNLYWHPDGKIFPQRIDSRLQWPRTQAIYFTEDPQYPGFADTVTLLHYADLTGFESWQDTHNIDGVNKTRGAAYAEEKARIAETLLKQAEPVLPGISSAADAWSLATPLTFRDYMAAPEGGMYGIASDVHAGGGTGLPVRTRLPNLFLTGQNVNLHGVLGVSLTAVSTCAELVGMEYLLKKIKAA